MSLETYIVAGLAVLLTGISKSGFAGGLGVLGVPLVALTMPPQSAAALLLPILIGIDLLSAWRYRTAWKPRMIIALLPGALLGISLGAAGFSSITPEHLRIAVGLMALLFVAAYVLRQKPASQSVAKANWIKTFAASTASGFAGFVAHAGGPPIKGTLLSLNLDKTAFVGTNALFFLVLNTAKAIGYGALGLFSRDGLVASASLVPFLFLGVGLGFALHTRIPQRTFTNLAYLLLALAGGNLLWLGISAALATGPS